MKKKPSGGKGSKKTKKPKSATSYYFGGIREGRTTPVPAFADATYKDIGTLIAAVPT